jgi:hypothetical protein
MITLAGNPPGWPSPGIAPDSNSRLAKIGSVELFRAEKGLSGPMNQPFECEALLKATAAWTMDLRTASLTLSP